jgi:glycosyltransferase involved in cell wall biosynthesis
LVKLSIITINLSNASGLRKTIESVVSQTSHEFEYIIIDGGSTDGSVEIIQSYTTISPGNYIPILHPSNPMPNAQCPMPLTYWISEPDRGIYHAMNKGIRVARGEYVQFLNSGDTLIKSDVIEKVVPILGDNGIYIGYMVKMFPNGKTILDKGVQGKITLLSLYNGGINHTSSFIKRDLFNKYGFFDETLRIVADWKWFLNAIGLNNEQVIYLKETISCFDMTGISNSNLSLLQRERRKTLEELIPANILADYYDHWRIIDQANRINHYKITKWMFWFLERVLFKLEKLSAKTHKKILD